MDEASPGAWPRTVRRWALVGAACLLFAAGCRASAGSGGSTSAAAELREPEPVTLASPTAPPFPAAAPQASPMTSPAPAPAPTPSPGPVAATDGPSWLDPVQGPGHLAPGSDPSVLPAPVLIADRGNDRLVVVDPQGRVRWEFPRPGDLADGQTFRVPDDAFFTPDGRQIVATEEDVDAVSIIDVATHRIVWRYGTPGTHGSGRTQLWHPDDAVELPSGDVLIPDIKNCRILLVTPDGKNTADVVLGGGSRPCRHRPPDRLASPNGAFPLADGNLLVTEINGDWVSEMTLDGTVVWSTHPPGFTYPSDTNEVGDGTYLSVDYRRPGTVETFDRQGTVQWRYRPTGADRLDKPSLARPLPNGDVIVTDDFNHRVIVVDPQTNRVVWQYGETGHAGDAPGLLRIPDGLDLLPPYGLVAGGPPPHVPGPDARSLSR